MHSTNVPGCSMAGHLNVQLQSYADSCTPLYLSLLNFDLMAWSKLHFTNGYTYLHCNVGHYATLFIPLQPRQLQIKTRSTAVIHKHVTLGCVNQSTHVTLDSADQLLPLQT